MPYPLGMHCPLCHSTVKFSGFMSIFILDEAMLTIKTKQKVNHFNVFDKQDVSDIFYTPLNLHSFCVMRIFVTSNE